jgi:hypothetical protein
MIFPTSTVGLSRGPIFSRGRGLGPGAGAGAEPGPGPALKIPYHGEVKSIKIVTLPPEMTFDDVIIGFSRNQASIYDRLP